LPACGTKPRPQTSGEPLARASHTGDSGRGRMCHRRDSAAALLAPAFRVRLGGLERSPGVKARPGLRHRRRTEGTSRDRPAGLLYARVAASWQRLGRVGRLVSAGRA
jgi:hypothetical protein